MRGGVASSKRLVALQPECSAVLHLALITMMMVACARAQNAVPSSTTPPSRPASVEGAVRLRQSESGKGPLNGFVQIFHINASRDVCHVFPENGWAQAAADVVCHQLCKDRSLNFSSQGFTMAMLDRPIWLASFECSGVESTLAQCNSYEVAVLPPSSQVLTNTRRNSPLCKVLRVQCSDKSYSGCNRKESVTGTSKTEVIVIACSASAIVFFLSIISALIFWIFCRQKHSQIVQDRRANEENRTRLNNEWQGDPQGNNNLLQEGRNGIELPRPSSQVNSVATMSDFNSGNPSTQTQESSVSMMNSGRPESLRLDHQQPPPDFKTPDSLLTEKTLEQASPSKPQVVQSSHPVLDETTILESEL